MRSDSPMRECWGGSVSKWTTHCGTNGERSQDPLARSHEHVLEYLVCSHPRSTPLQGLGFLFSVSLGRRCRRGAASRVMRFDDSRCGAAPLSPLCSDQPSCLFPGGGCLFAVLRARLRSPRQHRLPDDELIQKRDMIMGQKQRIARAAAANEQPAATQRRDLGLPRRCVIRLILPGVVGTGEGGTVPSGGHLAPLKTVEPRLGSGGGVAGPVRVCSPSGL